jgi:Putative Actinobacterial Holin-X, holin superfamily III
MNILLQLALEMAGLSARQVAARAARTSIILVVALIFMLIGLAGFTAALWIVLAHQTGPAVASLIIGGIGFVLAGILVLVARAGTGSRRTHRADPMQEAERALSDFMADTKGAARWTPLVAAAVIGFLLTRRR